MVKDLRFRSHRTHVALPPLPPASLHAQVYRRRLPDSPTSAPSFIASTPMKSHPVDSDFSLSACRRAPWRGWCLRLAAFALLPLTVPAQTSTSAVPGLISYQGKVTNAAGTAVGTGTPVNRKVTFRIWSHPSNSTINDLVYSEEQTVTISEGEFSALIGSGTQVTTSPLGYNESGKGPTANPIASAPVFGGATRYLGVTIDDGSDNADPEISPRQQLVTSAYAFRARYAEAVGSNGVNALTALDSGNVGINSANPGARLEVGGNIRAGGASVTSPQLQLLANHASNVAASIGFAGSSSNLSTDAAAIDTVVRTENGGKLLLQTGTGASAIAIDANNRVGIGTSAPNAALDVNGALMLRTTLTNASSRPAVGTSRVASEIGGYSSSGAFSDDGFLRLSAGGGTTASAKSFIDLTGFSNVADMDKTLVFGTAGAERLRINNSGALLLKAVLTNISTRPAVGTARITSEIAGYSASAVTNDDGFLRLSAGGGTNSATKSFIDLTGFSTVADMNMNLVLGTGGTERMRITSSGDVGIGTNAPEARLSIHSPGTSSGNNTATFKMGTGHVSHIHYGTTGDIFLRSSSSSGKIILQDSGGTVGIGTASPTQALLVVSGTAGSETVGVHSNLVTAGVGLATNPSYTFNDVSIKGTGAIHALYFRAVSDQRIKVVKGVSEGSHDLALLGQIKITDYTYRDEKTNGTRPQKKVIGQQVESVFPQAVTRATDVVPDIYKKAPARDGWVELATDLKVGERVRLVAPKSDEILEVLEVQPGRFRTAFTGTLGDLFVYGREVKDFRVVDYEAIAMLNVSATQELARQNDALRTANEALAARVAELEAKDRARDTKLAAIEKLLQADRTVMARPAAARANSNGQEQ